jgi:DHA1 family tetracycline resistance protein-like MFS transporter
MFGVGEVLVPLRIDNLDGGYGVIAGAFIVAAGIEAALAPVSGRYSDRVGRRRPFVTGLAIAALGMLGIGAAQDVGVVVAGLLIASLGAGLCFAPALTMLTETTESGPLQEGLAAGLSNMAWAAGQVVGGIAGGAAAGLAGYAAPCAAVAAVLLFTGVYALRRELPGTPAAAAVESSI